MNYMPYTETRKDNLLRRAMGKDPGPGDASNAEERDTGPETAEAARLREKENLIRERVKVKGRAKAKERVRTKGEKGQREDALIVAGPTTHPIAPKEKGAKQANCKISNKVVRGTRGGNKGNRGPTTQCPRH